MKAIHILQIYEFYSKAFATFLHPAEMLLLNVLQGPSKR